MLKEGRTVGILQHAELLAEGYTSSGTAGDKDKESSQQMTYSKGKESKFYGDWNLRRRRRKRRDWWL